MLFFLLQCAVSFSTLCSKKYCLTVKWFRCDAVKLSSLPYISKKKTWNYSKFWTVIRSTVNNFSGAGLVKSLLFRRRVEGAFMSSRFLHQVFVYAFIISLLHYLMPPSQVQSWVWGFNLLTHSAPCSPPLASPSCSAPGNLRGVILQRINQGKMKCTPDAFRWF